MRTTNTTTAKPMTPVRSGSRSRALLGKGTPPLAGIHWTSQRQQDVATDGSVDLDLHRTEVDVEEGPVRTKRGQPEVILAKLFDVVVDLGLPVIQFGGQRTGVFDDALQRPTRSPQQLSQIRRRGR